MKKILRFLSAGVLTGVLCVGFVACNKHDRPRHNLGYQWNSWADCFVWVTTIPGEETVLLAKRGFTFDEALALQADYESEYGKGNVLWDGDFPDASTDAYLKDPQIYHLGEVSECYEITTTIKLADDMASNPERVKNLMLSSWYKAVRVVGDTLIGKTYSWAFSEAEIGEFILWWEGEFYEYHAGVGEIINTTTKKLGPEVHNELIVF